MNTFSKSIEIKAAALLTIFPEAMERLVQQFIITTKYISFTDSKGIESLWSFRL